MPDTVLALVPRSNLSVVLTAFHRGGYGHVIRVLDPERAPICSQLHRAGISEPRMPTVMAPDSVIVFIPAPERTSQAAALAVANGATDIELANRRMPTSEAVAPRLISQASDRRDLRASRRASISPPAIAGQDAAVAD